jgi:pseudomonalisin
MQFPRSLAAACVAGAFASVSLVPAGAQTLWTGTATRGISVSELVSAADYGPMPASQPITVRVVLGLQNQTALDTYIENVNDPNNALYGQSLTPVQFAAMYAPGSAQVQQVVSYLQGAGFSNLAVEPNNLMVSADGTVAQAEAAFNTPIEQFTEFGNLDYGNTADAQVPASLGNIVGAVLGLNNIGQWKPTLVTRSQVSVPQYDVSYTPQQLQVAYGATGTATGSKATIAIMAEGNVSGVITDLRAEENANGLPQVPVTVVPVGIASTDTSGWDEWDLDTQYSTGMAQTVRMLYIYDTTSLTDSDLALEISRWATDDKAKGGSASLGECEAFPFLDGSMLADDESFA